VNHDELRALDRQHLWHPLTQHSLWGTPDPVLVMDRAEGFHLIDVDGKRYLDGVSSLWCNVHGHRVPELDDAIRAQLDKVAHSTLLGLSQTQSVLLAKELVDVAPEGLTRVFYSDSGATSVEAALKMAVQFHAQTGHPQRRSFVTLGDAYHGDTMGSVSLGFSDWFHRAFKHLSFPTIQVSSSDVDAAVAAIEKHAGELAGVVMEPMVQGAAGMIMQPRGYLRAVADACRKHNVLLICDEVAVGFGRTGRLWAVDHDNVKPDILCLAKGLSGGYLPLAATLTTERIFDAFKGVPSEARTFFHGHTFTGNALGCAVARASLKLLVENVLPTATERVAHLRAALQVMTQLQHVKEVRQLGFMVGIELVKDRASGAAWSVDERMGHKVCARARRYGVIIRPLGNVVVLMPAPAMPAPMLAELVNVTRDCIQDVTETH